MLTIAVEKSLNHSAELVWGHVGEFGSLAEWHPQVPACELSEDGLVRTIPVHPKSAVERMLPEKGGPMSYVYTVEEGPMPLKNYEATLGVRAEGDGSVIYYKATCEADGIDPTILKSMLENFFSVAFDAVDTQLSE